MDHPIDTQTEDLTSDSETKLLGLGRVSLILFVCFAALFIWAAGSYAFDLSRSSWPTTMGRISKAWEPPGPEHTATGLQVTYDYNVGVQAFSGQTFFAPGPEQPTIQFYSPGAAAKVFYNATNPAMSTLSPGSQCRLYVMYMVFALLAAVATIFVRPEQNIGREIRSQLPEFLDCLATLVESGLSVPAAVERANDMCAIRCPNLSIQLSKCVRNLKISKVAVLLTRYANRVVP